MVNLRKLTNIWHVIPVITAHPEKIITPSFSRSIAYGKICH